MTGKTRTLPALAEKIRNGYRISRADLDEWKDLFLHSDVEELLDEAGKLQKRFTPGKSHTPALGKEYLILSDFLDQCINIIICAVIAQGTGRTERYGRRKISCGIKDRALMPLNGIRTCLMT